MTKSKAAKKPTNAELQKQVKTLTAKVTKLTKQLQNATNRVAELESAAHGPVSETVLAEVLNVGQSAHTVDEFRKVYAGEEAALPNPFAVDSLRMPWEK